MLQFRNSLVLESLEHRRLLAGVIGDANDDSFFDEADLVQVMKLGKLGTGEQASWEEGDWNGDGEVNARDMIAAFQAGAYGEFDEADDRINELQPLSFIGDADVSIFYSPASGTVTAIAPVGMTALHLVSLSGSFSGFTGNSPFDVATESSQFVVHANGYKWIEYPRLLPIGWTEQQVIDDLLVDGAVVGGGDLGNVRLGSFLDIPEGPPEDALITVDPDAPIPFYDRDEATALLKYDPTTGDMLITPFGDAVAFEGVILDSPEGIFVGATNSDERYVVHAVDEATPHRFARLNIDFDGAHFSQTPTFARIYLPEVARTGLSAEQIENAITDHGGVTIPKEPGPNGPVKLTLEIGPIFSGCENHLANGSAVGDANLDGQFNSADLVAVFQSGEYEDATDGNSIWSDGDWNCDGDFNTSDLVTAFEAGSYEAAALLSLQSKPAWQNDSEPFVEDLAISINVKPRDLRLVAVAADFGRRQFESEESNNLVTDNVMLDLDIDSLFF